MNKKIKPSDLEAEAQRLIAAGQMPSLEELLGVMGEARKKYQRMRKSVTLDKLGEDLIKSLEQLSPEEREKLGQQVDQISKKKAPKVH
jgi:hypothetical protein